ncbi:MAG TPA: 4-phosphoerythronate dehydrogenase [Legionella sp.]|nr:4-phosphoerythronate dehydrogenase [Legionella sp.]
MKILADATLPQLTNLFPRPFTLTGYKTHNEIPKLLTDHEILLCRSTLRVDAALLTNSAIQCVATASSGIDHIDEDYLNQHQIALFDAKGSNARAVADYVVATLAALQRLGKSAGNLAGVIGIGEVGSRVVERLEAAGFKVVCYDPFKDPQDNRYRYGTLEDLMACDLLCLHPNLHASHPFPSKHLLNARFLNQLKSGVTIINASRGGIVDEEALLASSKPILYCTDVYSAEPSINPRIIDFATLCTPHIAGHSIEAKHAAVVQVSQKIHQHYGLTSPLFELPMPMTHVAASKHWQDLVLSFYNPMEDTERLKIAVDKKNAFLIQRQAHQFRHDFNQYALSTMNQQIRLLFAI